MEKILSILAIALMIINIGIIPCLATTYVVGGNSAWDISTDLDSWSIGKQFMVGDVLWFQYSSYHNVDEVTKENFDACSTSNVISSSSNGNTSFALTQPGQRFFVCGNRMHCLGGMRLAVNVESNKTLAPPAASPQAAVGTAAAIFPPSSKSNNPSAVVPSSSHSVQTNLVAAFGVLGIMRIVFEILL